MRYLNLGCGAVRPPAPWVNMDTLHDQLLPGTPERIQLDSESNYLNHNVLEPLPFPANTFDGILCSHVLEHFDCQQAAAIVKECWRVLRPGFPLVVSVPDAEYFLVVHHMDTPDRSVELFGEPICPAEPWHKSFFDYALFYNFHKQILTADSLTCLLIRGGFEDNGISPLIQTDAIINSHLFKKIPESVSKIAPLLNRRAFSVELCATKQDESA